jgi:CHAD domain-containing protein
VTTTTITADQPIAEAVRSLLADQFAVLLEQEAAYWTGGRKAAVHEMRVALRRMRVLLRLYGDRFTEQTLKRITPSIRRAGRALGTVRDLDVFIGHLNRHPEAEPGELEDLIAVWKKRRRKARRKLTRYLRSKHYRTLIEVMAEFTATPGSGVRPPASPHAPVEVRHVLGTSLWSRYESVWAYGPLLDTASMETLHELRIECKYLRYALEFFQPVLDETKSARLIATVVAAQDHLGQLHDASVAGEMLAADRKLPSRMPTWRPAKLMERSWSTPFHRSGTGSTTCASGATLPASSLPCRHPEPNSSRKLGSDLWESVDATEDLRSPDVDLHRFEHQLHTRCT